MSSQETTLNINVTGTMGPGAAPTPGVPAQPQTAVAPQPGFQAHQTRVANQNQIEQQERIRREAGGSASTGGSAVAAIQTATAMGQAGAAGIAGPAGGGGIAGLGAAAMRGAARVARGAGRGAIGRAGRFGAAGLALGAGGAIVAGVTEMGLSSMAEDLAKFSPDIAIAMAERRISDLQNQLDLAAAAGPDLADMVRAQTERQRAWVDIQEREIPALARGVTPVIRGEAETLRQVNTFLQFTGGIEGLARAVLDLLKKIAGVEENTTVGNIKDKLDKAMGRREAGRKAVEAAKKAPRMNIEIGND